MKTLVQIFCITNLIVILIGCSSKPVIVKEIIPPAELVLEKIQPDSISVADSLANLQLRNSPFSPSTQLTFSVPKTDSVEVGLFDINGTPVTRTFRSVLTQGDYQVNLRSIGLKSGVYFYRTFIGAVKSVKKIIIMK